MACGTSFYNQCFPNDSVTLALSTTAMHWLRDAPCNMTDALLPAWITLPEEKEKYRDQAEKDWELILLNRAAEMIRGICFKVTKCPIVILISASLEHH